MINAVIQGIVSSLEGEFENTCEIETEGRAPEAQRPGFSVSCLGSTERLFRGKKYFRKNQFCIRYVPAEGEGKKDWNETADRLFSCLGEITVGDGPVRGTEMKYEAGDDCFYFTVNYDMFLYRDADPLPRMEELTEKISAKRR